MRPDHISTRYTFVEKVFVRLNSQIVSVRVCVHAVRRTLALRLNTNTTASIIKQSIII